ncbi:MAG: carboxymuconolactone decarboxylase family protein [Candidatus Aminicenantes bacterium]|nr:carboxymuconolactone decarboxylase family protein [Candidatus Aminicenantes bacterium]
MGNYAEFVRFRQEMNKKILEQGNLDIKRFFALDEKTYQEGSLSKKVKELMGLSASMVLRCDDCIAYHIIQARAAGASRDELFETFSISLLAGGSIVIPHLRRAVALMEELEKSEDVSRE